MPSEAVEPPYNDCIDLPASGIGREFIERRATVLRAADACVHVFGSVPSTGRAIAPQIDQLVLADLVGRAHPCANSCPHARFPLALALNGLRFVVLVAAPFWLSHSRMPRRICSDTGMPSASRIASSASTRCGSMRMFIASLLSSLTWMSVSTRHHAMQAECADGSGRFAVRDFWSELHFLGSA